MALSKRDDKGKFLKGHSGNPTGGEKRFAFTRKFLNCVKLKDIAEVSAALIEKAKDGDLRAIKLFFQYVLVPPVQQIEQKLEVDTRSPEDIRKEFKAAFTTGTK